MNKTTILLILLAVCLVNKVEAQVTCNTLGQNPGTAFPVCGDLKFVQTTVPICGGRTVPGPCNEVILKDLNPFWYKFKCYKEGTLGFEITPNVLTDDYDWQLFDITDHNVEDVFTDEDLFVACNWSAYGGKTGASDEGNSLISCSGDNPIWSSMPSLVEGHEYLLLVSHFTSSQSGYSMEFKGGTAEINDEVPAVLTSSEGLCTGNSMYVTFDKPVKCSSIAEDGSDFTISGAGSVKVVSASSAFCSSGFTTDSIIVFFDQDVPKGNYMINLKQGSDGNTLLNICDIPVAESTMSFVMHETADATFAYNIRQGCTTDTVDFKHDGANSISKWSWTFDEVSFDNQSPTITYTTAGSKRANLVVYNEYCSDTADVVFELNPKIDAAFSGPEIVCAKDPASFTSTSTGAINSYHWDFGNNMQSTSATPEPFNYPAGTGEKTYKVTLTVSDASGCSDSVVSQVIVVGNCNIAVPSAFTPNNDGRNDELYPTNAFNADDLVFRVYDRFGRIVFETRDWRKRWDGKVNGQSQAAGTYIWSLSYSLRTSGRKYFFKGTTLLLR